MNGLLAESIDRLTSYGMSFMMLCGDYEAEGNAMEHRVSEKHQDVYIYKTRLTGDVRKSEKIKNVIGT